MNEYRVVRFCGSQCNERLIRNIRGNGREPVDLVDHRDLLEAESEAAQCQNRQMTMVATSSFRSQFRCLCFPQPAFFITRSSLAIPSLNAFAAYFSAILQIIR